MDFKDIAIIAAKEAGKVHSKYFQTDFKIETKTSSFDLLTIADLEAEEAVVNTIRKHFPDHNFLTEEKSHEATLSEYRWIVDPLDGTNNFAQGLPIFCASVALMKGNEIIIGAVYDASRDELFFAEKGKGAFLNDKPIKVSKVDSLERSLLITGFYYDRNKEMIKCLGDIKNFFQKPILGLRRLGAAALDLCYISCGRAAGFWEFCLSPWDFAAGKLLVEEAGGIVTEKQGKSFDLLNKSYVVASNGKIHQAMIEVLNAEVL